MPNPEQPPATGHWSFYIEISTSISQSIAQGNPHTWRRGKVYETVFLKRGRGYLLNISTSKVLADLYGPKSWTYEQGERHLYKAVKFTIWDSGFMMTRHVTGTEPYRHNGKAWLLVVSFLECRRTLVAYFIKWFSSIMISILSKSRNIYTLFEKVIGLFETVYPLFVYCFINVFLLRSNQKVRSCVCVALRNKILTCLFKNFISK